MFACFQQMRLQMNVIDTPYLFQRKNRKLHRRLPNTFDDLRQTYRVTPSYLPNDQISNYEWSRAIYWMNVSHLGIGGEYFWGWIFLWVNIFFKNYVLKRNMCMLVRVYEHGIAIFSSFKNYSKNSAYNKNTKVNTYVRNIHWHEL